jgi:hypothetical protein
VCSFVYVSEIELWRTENKGLLRMGSRPTPGVKREKLLKLGLELREKNRYVLTETKTVIKFSMLVGKLFYKSNQNKLWKS